ncbi:MAG: methyltransferase domain-containing protein [archaeon]|nr:methyltransferase domain-containing protein [archaeon]MCP8314293.1 methyltransferase domain-containing protein [archaeon]MCP8315769.1 methyltransferase domain-containing protein [archaeon]MCP8320332.1 methyltransferase domain-containing protein [archaeon]
MLSLPICPFDTTPDEVVRGMLEIAEVKPDDIVFDLGSGDGRIAITAAKEFGAIAYGVEIRKDLVKAARDKVRKLKLNFRVRIIYGDLFRADISRADAVFLYLTEGINIMLRPKLERELKLGARIVSHDYPIRGWVPKKIKTIGGHILYLYIKEKVIL